MTVNEQIVSDILHVLNNRGGFDNWWRRLNADTQHDIKNSMAYVVGVQRGFPHAPDEHFRLDYAAERLGRKVSPFQSTTRPNPADETRVFPKEFYYNESDNPAREPIVASNPEVEVQFVADKPKK